MMSIHESKVAAAEVAFFANKAYFDACVALKGNVRNEKVDFDAYAYLVIDSVPDSIGFGSTSKRFRSGLTRLNEFRRYLYFHKPDGLDVCESKEADSAGLSAACVPLQRYGIECHLQWSYRD